MRAPTVHLNGTSRGELQAQYAQAIMDLNKAVVALRRMHPHGRDYYTQEGNAISEAVEENVARVQRVQAVLDEVCDLYQGVM